MTVRYVKTGSADDYAMCEGYDMIASEVWYLRQGVDEIQRDVLHRLEDSLEFRRSALNDPENDYYYSEGPDDGSYDLDRLMSSFD